MNALKSLGTKYLAHLSAYIGHALAIVSLIPTAQLSPAARLIIAVAGIGATAADHGYKAGAGSQAIQAAVKSAVDILAAPAAKLVLACMLVAPLAFALPGCAQLAAFTQKAATAVTSPQAQPFVKAGALAAVAAAEQHGVSAQQINSVAKAALAADQGAGASLDAVKAVLDHELVKLNLPAGDLLAIVIVESEFNAYVQGQIGQDPTLAKAQAAAADIFQAVIDSTGG